MRFWTFDRKSVRVVGLLVLAAVLVCAWVFWPVGRLREPPQDPEVPPRPEAASESPAGRAAHESAADPEGATASKPEDFRTTRTDFFVEYRLEREMSRGRQIELLKAVAQDPGADETQRAAAQERLLQITRDLERETSLENILRAKGFRDAVVFFQENRATVVVPDLTSEEQATSIINLAVRGAGITPEDVMVIGHPDDFRP